MNHILRTAVIDYSDTQRRLITFLVEKHKNLDLIADGASTEDAIQILNQTVPDLLLLDIEIPGLDESHFLSGLSPKTQVVLITSNPDYALKAFDLGVTDYLLKPVRASRFSQAIDKALLRYPHITFPDQAVPCLNVKSDFEIKKIAIPDIRWIEALGDYVKIVTRREKILVLSTMTAIEEELPGDKFLRIHRSYIVNLKKVEYYSSNSVEIEGREIPMSRKRKNLLEELLLPVE